jgi:hypothetical protein
MTRKTRAPSYKATSSATSFSYTFPHHLPRALTPTSLLQPLYPSHRTPYLSPWANVTGLIQFRTNAVIRRTSVFPTLRLLQPRYRCLLCSFSADAHTLSTSQPQYPLLHRHTHSSLSHTRFSYEFSFLPRLPRTLPLNIGNHHCFTSWMGNPCRPGGGSAYVLLTPLPNLNPAPSPTIRNFFLSHTLYSSHTLSCRTLFTLAHSFLSHTQFWSHTPFCHSQYPLVHTQWAAPCAPLVAANRVIKLATLTHRPSVAHRTFFNLTSSLATAPWPLTWSTARSTASPRRSAPTMAAPWLTTRLASPRPVSPPRI